MGISLDKVAAKAPALLSLAKTADVALDKYKLNGTKAKVALVLDYSGSMNRQYKSGAMQRLVEKVLSLAVHLDDDGAIEFFVFDSNAAYLGDISLDDYVGSVDRLTKGRSMGTTNYAAAFKAVQDHYGYGNITPIPPAKRRGLFGKKVAPVQDAAVKPQTADEPVFAIFLTDGAPDNRTAAVQALTTAASAPIFWKFLSIGSEDMAFLQKLDDLDDRFIDNADYKNIRDVEAISDTDLYDALLDEYPTYLAEARDKGLLR